MKQVAMNLYLDEKRNTDLNMYCRLHHISKQKLFESLVDEVLAEYHREMQIKYQSERGLKNDYL